MWQRLIAHPVYFKDPWSALTHFGGFVAALVGVVVLVVLSVHDPVKQAGMAVYGGSLALLFAASSAYHFLDLGQEGNRWLRRLDHAAIFLLIAGTYVPILLHTLDGAWRLGMLVTVGLLALAGVLLKLVWLESPTWLSVGTYLLMGWVVVVPAHRIFPALSAAQLSLLVAGGLVYTGGAAVYSLKRPNPWPGVFGHHEVWHLFVLVGAALHFALVLALVEVAVPGA